ncbi:hypothetical protein ACNUDM_22090 [Vibrio chaetopteri]|uniref:hypothetical protein n=1 Tax=Vibrio chaetopteri TaxID=3016528 RepID=UPI003AB37DBF
MADRTEYQKNYYTQNHKAIIQKAAERSRKAKASKTFNELASELATVKQLETAKYLHSLLPEFDIKSDYMVLLYREYERSKLEIDFKQWLVERLNNAD